MRNAENKKLKIEVGSGNGEFGRQKTEGRSWKLEWGNLNSEVGMRKAEAFDCGFWIADFGLKRNKIDQIPITNQPINQSTNQLNL
jgi:hypothetical protein